MEQLRKGRDTEVVFDERQPSVKAQYWLVPVGEMRSSVTTTLLKDANFPAELQNRSYVFAEGAAARELVEGTVLDPRHVLDTTAFAALGPPVCLPNGVVIAGTHRSLVLRRAEAFYKERWQKYQQALQAPEILAFAGISIDALPPDAALVRVLTEDRSDAQWSRLNALSDEPLSKSFDPLSRAVRAARQLRDNSRSLEFLRKALQTSTSAQPLTQVLNSKTGYEFVRLLLTDGVLHRHRLPEATTWMHGRVAAALRREIVELLHARTLGTIAVVRYLKNIPEAAHVVEPALLTLATATGVNATWLREAVCEAIQYHFDGGFVMHAETKREPLGLMPSFHKRPREEVAEICGWLSRAQDTSLLAPVREFLNRTSRPIPPPPDPLPNGELFPELLSAPLGAPNAADECAMFQAICHETFGAAALTALPRTAEGLRYLLTDIRNLTRKRQGTFTLALLPDRVVERARALLTPEAKEKRARGRPMLPVDNIVRAVALLRRAGVPERHYHRFWRRFPVTFSCGAWTTFVSRRRAWMRAEPSVWEQLCTLLDEASQAAPQ